MNQAGKLRVSATTSSIVVGVLGGLQHKHDLSVILALCVVLG